MSTFPESAAGGMSEPALPSFWAAVRASLAGRRQDYTKLPLPRAILLLAVPMALELMMESTFGLVDIFFVSKLGPAAVATVGLTEAVVILLFAIALGLSIGATATVARRIGEGDEAGAAKAAAQAILAGIAVSIPFGLFGWFWANELLTWMGGTPDVVAGSGFAAILLGGSPTIFLLFLNNAIFRGAGDAAIAMRALGLANLFNIVLDPCLIFGLGPFPEMGLEGAAVATNIGRGLGVAFQFWALASGGRRVVLRRKLLHFDWTIMRPLLYISRKAMAQFFIATASWLGVMRIVALLGDDALAGYTIAVRIIHFAILPSWGMSNAVSTLVGQNLGANRPDRAEESVWLTGRYNFVFLAVTAVVFGLSADYLVSLFSSDAAVVAAGAEALRVSSFAYVFSAYTSSFAQAFNGAGDSSTPMKINFYVLWLLQLPLTYLLSQTLGLGLTGAMAAIVASMAAWAIVGFLVFRRGDWKLVKA
jgi:putative MATE family efflux protein